MSTHVSSLPDNWVERIWSTMRAFYGATFDRQWECPPGVRPEDHVRDLKAIWSRELRGFQQNPKAIAYALDHLPEFPPNLPQFLAICKRAPIFAPPALPWPKPPKEIVEKVVQGFVRHRVAPRDWMAKVQARIDSGERVSVSVRTMLANAQKHAVNPTAGVAE